MQLSLKSENILEKYYIRKTLVSVFVKRILLILVNFCKYIYLQTQHDVLILFIRVGNIVPQCYYFLVLTKERTSLNAKYIISTPLIIEKPVRRPIVPPIADSLSTNFAALSLVILSNVGVSKCILTYLRVLFH